jgi:hypothetical protein
VSGYVNAREHFQTATRRTIGTQCLLRGHRNHPWISAITAALLNLTHWYGVHSTELWLKPYHGEVGHELCIQPGPILSSR